MENTGADRARRGEETADHREEMALGEHAVSRRPELLVKFKSGVSRSAIEKLDLAVSTIESKIESRMLQAGNRSTTSTTLKRQLSWRSISHSRKLNTLNRISRSISLKR